MRILRVCGAIGFVLLGVLGSAPGRAESEGTIVFSGSAAASGAQLTMTVPGAPVTDTPIDGGGPTAQVQLDSIGSSSGYASFPDPGGIAISGPTTFAGLLAGGVGPIPPITFPAPPPAYPFYIQSNSGNAPERSVGSGPYQLSAASDASSSTASAMTGIRTEAAGNLGLVTSTASMKVTDAGVVGQATSDAVGLSAGPLTIGEIKSTAKQVLTPDGTVTPSTALEITGMRIGNLPISFTPDGLLIGAASQKFPVNETLASLLGPSQISLQFMQEQKFPDRVVAPAVRLVMPAPSASGKGQGSVTLIFGRATVALTGLASEEKALPSLPGVGTDSPPAAETSLPAGSSGRGGGLIDLSRPVGAVRDDQSKSSVIGGGVVAAPLAPTASGVTTGALQPAAAAVPVFAQSGEMAGVFRVSSLYATFAFGAAAALILGSLARLIGARRP